MLLRLFGVYKSRNCMQQFLRVGEQLAQCGDQSVQFTGMQRQTLSRRKQHYGRSWSTYWRSGGMVMVLKTSKFSQNSTKKRLKMQFLSNVYTTYFYRLMTARLAYVSKSSDNFWQIQGKTSVAHFLQSLYLDPMVCDP